MKKLLLSALAVCAFTFSNAQEDEKSTSSALTQGSIVIEANTGSWTTGNTAFSLSSVDGNTAYNVGVEGGYFVMDNLAIKAGLGYGDASSEDDVDGTFTYKLGAKYYLAGQFPVGVDYTGASQDGESISYVGLQGGYAWFVADNISVEPTVRYNMTLDDEKAESGFQGLIGFALHF